MVQPLMVLASINSHAQYQLIHQKYLYQNHHNLTLRWDTILYLNVPEYIPVQAQWPGHPNASLISVYYYVHF